VVIFTAIIHIPQCTAKMINTHTVGVLLATVLIDLLKCKTRTDIPLKGVVHFKKKFC